MQELRTPKGTKDLNPQDSAFYNEIISRVQSIFEQHGAVNINTPIIELKDVLCNKYGEDSKLIYDLKDQGGDICALRYDLTVPFARYLATNKTAKIKRYQVGQVFRRDQPSIAKGRLREFTQCDFDIAGSYLPMLADAEVICVANRCIKSLNLGGHKIKINNRMVLNSIVKIAKIDSSKFAAVCSAIDKMDKLPWKDISSELLTKGVDELQIEVIKRYVSISGTSEVLEVLKNDAIYLEEDGKTGIDDLILLDSYLRSFGVEDANYIFDLSLARGLDYYTGVIFEVVLDKFKDIGSIAAGGRYDNLVSSIFPDTQKASNDVPCVGFSVGITRISSVFRPTEARISKTKVFVGSSGSLLTSERLQVLRKLWEHKIPAETFYIKKNNFANLLTQVKKIGAPYFLIVGESELKNNTVNLIYGDSYEIKKIDTLENVIEFILNN